LLCEEPIRINPIGALRESRIHELPFGSDPIGDGVFQVDGKAVQSGEKRAWILGDPFRVFQVLGNLPPIPVVLEPQSGGLESGSLECERRVGSHKTGCSMNFVPEAVPVGVSQACPLPSKWIVVWIVQDGFWIRTKGAMRLSVRSQEAPQENKGKATGDLRLHVLSCGESIHRDERVRFIREVRPPWGGEYVCDESGTRCGRGEAMKWKSRERLDERGVKCAFWVEVGRGRIG